MLQAIIFIIILIFSIIIHEYAHGYIAYQLGDDTAYRAGRLTLNPLAHLDPLGSVIVPLLFYLSAGFVFGWAKPVPYNPYNLKDQRWGPAKVAIAGPASNFAVALIFALLLRIFPLQIFTFIILINIILGIFNLVPIPPLDGSKILFALLPDRYWKLKANLEQFGFIFIILFIFLGWPLIWPMIDFAFKLLVS